MPIVFDMLRRVLLIAAVVGIARPAAADLYSDGKAIIEELIEDNISTQIIPNAAAKVPALCTYFPASMEAIRTKRYTGLQTLLRKEIADFIGLKTYLYTSGALDNLDQLKRINPKAFDIKNLKSRLTGHTLADGETVSAEIEATADFAATIAHHGSEPTEIQEALRTVQSSVQSQAPQDQTSCVGPDGSAHFSDRTSLATEQMAKCAAPSEKEEIPCATALLARDAFDGNDSLVLDDVKRLGNAVKVLAGKEVPELAALNLKTSITLDAAVALVGFLANNYCSHDATCKRLLSWTVHSGSAREIAELIAEIQRRDYGAAARTVIDAAHNLACQGSSAPICGDDKKLIWTFVTNLSVYLVDSATAANNSETAEADFRNSAIDLIKQYGSGLGYTRKVGSLRSILVPQGALRESWRPGQVNPDATTLARYASLDWITFSAPPLKYTEYFYMRAQLSVFDLLGPFSELATSGHLLDGDKHRTQAFLWGFFVPRVEINFAIPGFSRNLMVGVSGAFRVQRAKLSSTMDASYCFAWAHDGAPTCHSVDNLEFGVHVKYVP